MTCSNDELYIRIEISNQARAFSYITMRVPVPGGVGGGERPHTTFLAKSVDETMAFSRRLAMISRLAADHRIL